MRIILVWSYSFSCHKKYIRQIVNLNSNGHKSNKTIKWKLFKQLFYGWLTNFPTFCQCNWSFWIINMKIGNLTIIYFWGHSIVNSLCKTLFCKCPVEWSVVIVNMNYNFYSAQTRSPWVVNSISCPELQLLQLLQLHQARTEY